METTNSWFKKSFMNHEFVVSMLVQAFQTGTVAAHTVHAWRRAAGKDQPFRIQRMKLRVDHSPIERNHMPAASIRAPGCDSIPAILLHIGCQPFAIRAGRAFTELGAREI